jgi:hypothetical protein
MSAFNTRALPFFAWSNQSSGVLSISLPLIMLYETSTKRIASINRAKYRYCSFPSFVPVDAAYR